MGFLSGGCGVPSSLLGTPVVCDLVSALSVAGDVVYPNCGGTVKVIKLCTLK